MLKRQLLLSALFPSTMVLLLAGGSLAGCGAPAEAELVPIKLAPLSCTESAAAAAGTADEGLPARPESGAPPGATERLFAVSRFYLGEVDLNPYNDADAPDELGFNLDRTITERKGTYCTCFPVGGASNSYQRDGELGRDNAFGNILLQTLAILVEDPEARTNEAVAAGEFSWLLQLPGVGDEATYTGLGARIYEGAPLTDDAGKALTPAFDGSDVWPRAMEGLVGGDAEEPLLTFEDAYLVPGADGASLWVGRGKGTIRLHLPVQLRLVIHDPVVVLPLGSDRTTISRGMLGGTLDPDEIAPEVERVSGFFVGWDDRSFCPPSQTTLGIIELVHESADMLATGGPDHRTACDRVSIGIAFDAVPIAGLGPARPAAPISYPCDEE